MTEKTNHPFDTPEIPQFQFPTFDNSIKYYKQTVPVNMYQFYLVDTIDDVSKYLDMINVLRTAEEHDTITMCINNAGGNISTTIQIIAAMRESKATVITSLEGEACSAATLLFLSGHQFAVHPNASFMIHTYSQWAGGKGHENDARADFNKKFFKNLFKDIYEGFLSKKEIKKVLNGKDLWFGSEEVIERLEQFSAVHAEKSRELQREAAMTTLASMEEYKSEVYEDFGISLEDSEDVPLSTCAPDESSDFPEEDIEKAAESIVDRILGKKNKKK